MGLIAPGTCDSHRKTRLASMDVLASLLDLHGTGRVVWVGRTGALQAQREDQYQGVGCGAVLGVGRDCGLSVDKQG